MRIDLDHGADEYEELVPGSRIYIYTPAPRHAIIWTMVLMTKSNWYQVVV